MDTGALATDAVLHELAVWHAELSATLFEGALRPPVFDLRDMKPLGLWVGRERRLCLSESLVREASWGAVIEVLKHEMAHQYVGEVLGITDETAHGTTFREVCIARGIDERAAGKPLEGGAAPSKILAKVRKLMALATSPEPHEAKAAMKAASRLMLQHNLELVERGDEGTYGWRHLGAVRARTPKHERILAGILGKHFFVQSIWARSFDVRRGKRGRVLEICGTEANLAIAEYVHEYVMGTAERLWSGHRAAQGIRGNKDRRRYLEGVMLGFWEQLEGQGRQHAETGLVWVGDAALEDWVGTRHRRLRSTRRIGVALGDAAKAGREAGRSMVLRKGVEGRAASGGRLLGGG